MSITDPNPPTPARLTPMDKAVQLYRSFGEDFVELLNHYISFFPEAKRYTFFGPDYILLAHEETRADPHDPENTETRDPYWFVVYASNGSGGTGGLFRRLMPYHLDYVGFSRQAKEKNPRMHFHLTTELLNRT